MNIENSKNFLSSSVVLVGGRKKIYVFVWGVRYMVAFADTEK